MRVPEEGLVRVSGCRTFGRVVFRRMSLGQDWWGVQSEGERGFWRQSPFSKHKAYGVTSASASLLPPRLKLSTGTKYPVSVPEQRYFARSDTKYPVSVSIQQRVRIVSAKTRKFAGEPQNGASFLAYLLIFRRLRFTL